jgi:hypothetical protein
MQTKIVLAASALILGLIAGCGSDNPTTTTAGSGGSGSGSGGAGSGGGGIAAGSDVALTGGTLTAVQKTANDLVAAANGGVATLSKAEGASNVPGLGGVATTIQCSTFGGTGSITQDVTTSGTSVAGTTVSVSYNACTFSGYTFNGTVTQTYDTYASAQDFSLTQTYSNFTVSGNGLTNEAVSGSSRCVYRNGTADCAQYVGGFRVSNVELSTSGSTTTVRSGVLGGSTAYGNANCTYNGWVFNNTTGRANSGTVSFDYGNGNTATVTATSTGYTVSLRINGTTTNYTVALS